MGGQSYGGRGMTGQGTWNAGTKNWRERYDMGGMQGQFAGRGP